MCNSLLWYPVLQIVTLGLPEHPAPPPQLKNMLLCLGTPFSGLWPGISEEQAGVIVGFTLLVCASLKSQLFVAWCPMSWKPLFLMNFFIFTFRWESKSRLLAGLGWKPKFSYDQVLKKERMWKIWNWCYLGFYLALASYLPFAWLISLQH